MYVNDEMSPILDSSKHVNTNLPVSNLVEYLSKIFDVEQARSAVLENIDKTRDPLHVFVFTVTACALKDIATDKPTTTHNYYRTTYQNRPSFA